MILYAKKTGKIIAQGEFTETTTHYIQDGCYFDKTTVNLIDLPNVDDLKKWKIDINTLSVVRNIEKGVSDWNILISRLKEFGILQEIYILAQTDVNLKIFIDTALANASYMLLTDESFVEGVNYLLYLELITEEQKNILLEI